MKEKFLNLTSLKSLKLFSDAEFAYISVLLKANTEMKVGRTDEVLWGKGFTKLFYVLVTGTQVFKNRRICVYD